MFTRTDLATLDARAPRLGASIFMPTYIRGADIRQGPIRLKNLLSQVCEQLSAIGLRQAETDEFIAPAAALIDDYVFWQHQDEGLALFLDSEGMRQFKVPLALTEQIVVGPGFHFKPLLPLLAADGLFTILTMTADRARLYAASRFTCTEVEDANLPINLEADRSESGSEQPSPNVRPKAGFVGVGGVWAEGDRPTQWRENRLEQFVRRAAVAVEHRLGANPQPLILVAEAKTSAQFKKVSSVMSFGPLITGVVTANPDSMTERQLHDTACALMQKHLNAPGIAAEEQLDTLLGRGDPRATADVGEVVRAAYQGRVNTMFLAEDETVWGRYEQEIDQIITGGEIKQEDLLEAAAVQTLQHGGEIHLRAKSHPAEPPTAAALLRF